MSDSNMSAITRLIYVFILGLTIQESYGRIRHCYVCRSRGELGDCKDPFQYNVTTVEGVKGLEAVPCASGWCGKIVEGENDDFDTATERLCVQRPPTDGEERCANTIIERKPVYMCFCLGDLCNGAESLNRVHSLYLAILPFIVMILSRKIVA